MEAEFEGGLVGKFPNRDEFYLGYAFYLGFVEELGVGPGQVEYYAGLAVSVNALADLDGAYLGSLADRYGRKPMMVRAPLR